MIRSLIVVAALGLLTCSPAHAKAAGGVGSRITARASQLIGVRSLRTVDQTVPDDCTGLVRLAYESAGIELMDGGGRRGDNGVMILYRKARSLRAVHRGRPKPGDLAFFRETYDRNRDGRRNDGLTHVGIVERVGDDGLITLIHRGSKGVTRTRMNLQRPTLHREKRGGAVVNDYLRTPSRKHRAYLAGELFAGFASPEPLSRARRVSPLR